MCVCLTSIPLVAVAPHYTSLQRLNYFNVRWLLYLTSFCSVLIITTYIGRIIHIFCIFKTSRHSYIFKYCRPQGKREMYSTRSFGARDKMSIIPFCLGIIVLLNLWSISMEERRETQFVASLPSSFIKGTCQLASKEMEKYFVNSGIKDDSIWWHWV